MLNKPAIIWAVDFSDGRAMRCSQEESLPCAAGTGEFRWIHLNLADAWTLQWIEEADTLPAQLKQVLLSSERHQEALVDQGWIACVLHDVERDFDRHDAERTGALRLVLGERLMITGRHHPLRSADIVRNRLLDGEPVRDAAAALALAVSAILHNVNVVARSQASQIETFEDQLLDHTAAFDHRRLISIRRRVVQFHRLLIGMRAVFKRLEADADLPPPLLPTVERLTQQLGQLDGDMVAIHGQLRLLREEADLQATQRTNQNLYVLSMLSALLLPATAVTGFFGMNTGGLPFADSSAGTAVALVLGVGSSLAVYFGLRTLGLVHRN